MAAMGGFRFKELPEFIPCDRDVSPLSGNRCSSEVISPSFIAKLQPLLAVSPSLHCKRKLPIFPLLFELNISLSGVGDAGESALSRADSVSQSPLAWF